MLSEGYVCSGLDKQILGEGCKGEAVSAFLGHWKMSKGSESRIQLTTNRYGCINIVGNDSPAQLKKFKAKHGTRLRLLRRTLREKRALASLVKELRVPDLEILPLKENGKRNEQYDDYRDLVASVIMACPNLERLTGFRTLYNHEFDRLTHALSTRKKLKEHTWLIGENSAVTTRSRTHLSPGIMDEYQTMEFLSYHYHWTNLETLFLHSPGDGIIEPYVFTALFNHLPSLKDLCISSFDEDDFTDSTLCTIPPLRSLRLQNLPGVTTRGLSRYASTGSMRTLEHLSLIHTPITSLLVISKLLTSAPGLKTFTIVQSPAPELPIGDDLIVMQPLLASATLRNIHWDIHSQIVSSIATTHLAASIRAGGFPSLRRIRAPVDPEGLLQDVCAPAYNASVLHPSDRYSTAASVTPISPVLRQRSFPIKFSKRASTSTASTHTTNTTTASITTSNSSLNGSFTSPILTPPTNRGQTSLCWARKTAQARIDEVISAQQVESTNPYISVRVEDYGSFDAPVRDAKPQIFHFPRFIGTIQSKIKYDLSPDVEGRDVGVLEWGDLGIPDVELEEKEGKMYGATGKGLVGKNGVGLGAGSAVKRGKCRGEWLGPDGRTQKTWAHTERERRGLLGLESFLR